MNAEATDTVKTKPRLNIPAGALIIIPMRNRVLFPSMVMPLMVVRPARRQAVEEAVRQQLPIGFVVQRDPNIETPQPKDLYGVGTAADVFTDVYPARRSASGHRARPPPFRNRRIYSDRSGTPSSAHHCGAELTQDARQ